MAQRTTKTLVREVLAENYDGKTGLQQFIDTASVMVDRVAACASKKGKTLTDGELELIERWLAAHCYARVDLTMQNKSTSAGGGAASATFQGQTGMYLESTYYGQMAMNVDFSGCLTVLSKRQMASVFWAGKKNPPDYTDAPQPPTTS